MGLDGQIIADDDKKIQIHNNDGFFLCIML